MARVEAAKKLQTIQKSSQLDIYGYGPKKGLRRIFQPRAEKDLESN
jgi:hypothetical protein